MEPLRSEDPCSIAGYRLRGRLGEGGMGVVYLARAGRRRVAVKTMRAADLGDPAARARFCAEAGYARRIRCRHTAEVIADGSGEALPYLVTEYVAGPPLASVVERAGPLTPGALHAVALGVADALAEIHRAGVVHRDVTPANVLLSDTGPRVIDFGIAYGTGHPVGVTEIGTVMGSPGWIAPERLRGAPAGPAADVFCWGLLVSYAATGRHPFGIGDLGKRPDRILTLAPDLAGLTEPLRSLVGAALVKDPAARPEAADLRHSLMTPRAERTAALAVEHLWSPPALPSKPRNGRNRRNRRNPREPREPQAPSKLVNRRTAGLLTAAAAAVLATVLLALTVTGSGTPPGSPAMLVITPHTPGPSNAVTPTPKRHTSEPAQGGPDAMKENRPDGNSGGHGKQTKGKKGPGRHG